VGNDRVVRETGAVITDRDRDGWAAAPDAAPAPPTPGVTMLYHYSEDGSIRRFTPHVPPTNPSHPPAVWAIDEAHSPLYWFPRHCPRISVWATTAAQQRVLTDTFGTESNRICAAECHWLTRVRDASIFRYSFDPSSFAPWTEADGQYISGDVVVPESVEVLDDLLGLHAAAEVELRFTVRLGVLMDQMLASGLPFSFVRIRDARR
jgi:hypothetical protein